MTTKCWILVLVLSLGIALPASATFRHRHPSRVPDYRQIAPGAGVEIQQISFELNGVQYR